VSFIEKLRERVRQVARLETRLQLIQESLGRIEQRQLRALNVPGLQANEFRVFSQWGEDGIIQHLVRQIGLKRDVFIEFGVENYVESNTRFLLSNDNWAGLIIDGSEENIQFVRNDPIYWRHNLKAECSFITAENINDLISRNGIRGDIGLLSVDIDGNDYWVWKAIDVVNPVIVVAEYNARFGPTEAVTTPYDPKFVRSTAHHSYIYYGASLAALTALGKEKGYVLVGCNSAGNNAFFVRADRVPASLPPMSPVQAYVRNQFRETRGEDGRLRFVAPEDEHAVLAGLPLVKVG
jgi:hypothetical protein